jgi:hypothetical protein
LTSENLAALTDSATIIWQIKGGKKKNVAWGSSSQMASQACQYRAGGQTDGRTDARAGPRWRAGWRARRGEEELAALLLLTTFRQKEKLKIKDSKKK